MARYSRTCFSGAFSATSCWALCWSDGRSQFVVDFSIHGERGKVDGKEQGLTGWQRERRYNRKRDSDCQSEKRKEEYFVSKLERLKSMVKDAIRHHIPFDYLLVDSWFICTELVDFVYRSHKKFHLLGMAKMGNPNIGRKVLMS